jgi:hypothetical protein
LLVANLRGMTGIRRANQPPPAVSPPPDGAPVPTTGGASGAERALGCGNRAMGHHR